MEVPEALAGPVPIQLAQGAQEPNKAEAELLKDSCVGWN